MAAEVALGIVLNKLTDFLTDEVKVLSGVNAEFEDIKVELEFISSFLRDADAKAARESNDNNNGLKTWVKHVREAAFDIEDVIDGYMLHVERRHHRHGFKALLGKLDCLNGVIRRHVMASKIQDIKTRVHEIGEKRQRYGLNSFGGGIVSDPRMGVHFVEKDALVGIDSLREDLARELMHGELNRMVVSVVGMGGVGKTTLAKKVADEQIDTGHFDCHAWITVSQSYKVEELLKTMIRQFYESRREPCPSELINATNGVELIGKCREYLQDKRYFVVFDDVWKEGFWGDVEYALFGNDKSSRIMVTTRNMNVVEFCKRSALVHVHELKPLLLEMAQELLCRIAFQFDRDKQCPLELKDLSFDIARKCEGLPLAIVAIGGLLSAKGGDVAEWQSLNRSLKSELESNMHLTRIKTVLSYSYHDLPYHLKSCFLFFGMFPEDYVVNCARLVRLWIAEGFVKEQHDAEEVAREYLSQLINRNLVQVGPVDFNGVVRECRVHDLIHDLILSKSDDLNFFIQTSATQSINQTARHLSLQSVSSNNLLWNRIRSSKAHSMIFFEVKEFPKSLLRSIFSNFKLLKELDFEGAPLDHLPDELGNLLHLKYLSVRDTKVETLPKSIAKLHKLETLDLKRSLVHQLPVEINKLSNLKFLLAYCDIDDDTRHGVKIHGKVQCLSSIEKLYYMDVDGRKGLDLVSELKHLKHLRKLGITNLKSEGGTALCNAIEQMSVLESLQIISVNEDETLQLQSMSSPPLYLCCLRLQGRLEKLSHWISHLKYLVRIRLFWSQLSEIPLNILGELPELLELELHKGYNGTQLHFEDGFFPALKVLTLSSLDRLNGLRIDENALRLVEQLYIGSCPELKKLPSDICHLRCLNLFEVDAMPKEFVRRMLPDVGEDHWLVQSITNIYIYMMDSEQRYSTYKLGDSSLLDYLY